MNKTYTNEVRYCRDEVVLSSGEALGKLYIKGEVSRRRNSRCTVATKVSNPTSASKGFLISQ